MFYKAVSCLLNIA